MYLGGRAIAFGRSYERSATLRNGASILARGTNTRHLSGGRADLRRRRRRRRPRLRLSPTGASPLTIPPNLFREAPPEHSLYSRPFRDLCVVTQATVPLYNARKSMSRDERRILISRPADPRAIVRARFAPK